MLNHRLGMIRQVALETKPVYSMPTQLNARQIDTLAAFVSRH